MAHPAAELPVHELSRDERLDLLGRLWDSLLDEGPPPTPDWHLEEVRRRLSDARAGTIGSVSLDELRRELKEGRA